MIGHGVLRLLFGAVLVLTVTGRPPIDTENACDEVYDPQYITNMHFKYNGHPTHHMALEDEGWGFRQTQICEINFDMDHNDFAMDHKLCFKMKSLNLDCGTVIEYDTWSYDSQYTCEQNYSSTFEETCFTPSLTTTSIIIRKVDPKSRTNESATIHVYTKEYEPITFEPPIVEAKTDYTWVIIVFALGLIGVLVGVTVYILKIKHKRRQQELENTQTTLSNDTGNRSSMVPDNSVQQSAEGFAHQTEYPRQHSAATGPYHYQSVPQSKDSKIPVASGVSPSAPPEEELIEPPPSYESVMNK